MNSRFLAAGVGECEARPEAHRVFTIDEFILELKKTLPWDEAFDDKLYQHRYLRLCLAEFIEDVDPTTGLLRALRLVRCIQMCQMKLQLFGSDNPSAAFAAQRQAIERRRHLLNQLDDLRCHYDEYRAELTTAIEAIEERVTDLEMSECAASEWTGPDMLSAALIDPSGESGNSLLSTALWGIPDPRRLGRRGNARGDSASAWRGWLVAELDNFVPRRIVRRGAVIAGLINFIGLRTKSDQVNAILRSRRAAKPRAPRTSSTAGADVMCLMPKRGQRF